MNNLTQFPDLDAAREDAALWVARQDRGLTAAESTELQQWLQAPANRRAFQEMGGVWQRMDVMSVLADVFPRERAPRIQRVLPWALGTAAACALAVTAVLLLPRAADDAPAVASVLRVQAFATAIGEQRTIALHDGSSLVLNTHSLVEVSFTDATRRLHLRRGEAHFKVAHDAARPFVVGAGDHDVRATGTAFNIRLHADDATDVLVTEGSVVVTDSGNSTNQSAVAMGQLLALQPDGSRATKDLDASAIEARLAWRRNELVFDGETLATALQEVSRYSTRRIELADEALGARRIAGYFPTDDLPALLQSLQANFGVRVTETPTVIRLSAAAQTE